MAHFPCSIDNARYTGRQQTFYVGIVKGTESVRYRLRLCPQHFSAVEDNLAQFKINPVDGTAPWFGTGAKCISCLEPMDELGWQFFGTSYPANQEREDYWGGLHDRHDTPAYLQPQDGPQAPPSRTPLTAFLQAAATKVPEAAPNGSVGSPRKP